MIGRLDRIWETLRLLRPEQFADRAVRRMRRKLRVPSIVPAMRACGRVVVREIPCQVRHRARPVEGLIDGSLEFHGIRRPISALPWNDPGVPQLWRYQIHYFEYAIDLLGAWEKSRDARFVERFDGLVLAWLAANPPESGDGWHPYTVSLRLCAWARARVGFGDALRRTTRESIDASMLDQYAYLLRNLERDVLGNHLLENLRALAVAGVVIDGPLGEAGRRRARTQLEEQVARQVLPDGGHYERSPMYHSIVETTIVETVEALEARDLIVAPFVHDALPRMGVFRRALRAGDGEPELFGDSVRGEAPLPDDADDEPAARCALFADTGFAVLRSADGRDRVVFDVGRTCPDELPAHGQCDALSFTLERDRRPVIIDPGVFEYAAGPWRDHSRSTLAHNTVAIDGAEQADVWASFRVGRRAFELPIRTDESPDGAVWVEGGHDGYRRTRSRAVHRRRITSNPDGWAIADRIRCRDVCFAEANLLLAPDVEPELSEDGRRLIGRRDGEVVLDLTWEGWGSARLIGPEGKGRGAWAFPRFGERVETRALRLEARIERDRRFCLRIADLA